MAGHASTMSISNCTFSNNSAPTAGGSIYIVSRAVSSANGSFSRLNELSITDCTFKNDSYTSISNSGTINASLGGAMSLDSSINKVNISGCTFDKLLATEGAGVCFGYTNLTAQPNGS
jgi:predicted outer membrane repeat protein